MLNFNFKKIGIYPKGFIYSLKYIEMIVSFQLEAQNNQSFNECCLKRLVSICFELDYAKEFSELAKKKLLILSTTTLNSYIEYEKE